MEKQSAMTAIHWAARIIGTLMVAFTLVMLVGSYFEGLKKQGPPPDSYTILLFIVWGIGLAGLLMALWRPGLGGIISLVGFIVFNILAAVNPNPDAGYTPILLFFLIPSILYVYYWRYKKAAQPA